MATINLGRIKPVFRGAYSGATAYVVDDIVTSGNETYICIQAHSAGTQAVSVTAYWTKLAAKGTDGTDLTSTLTTQGDVLYRDGSGLARLAAGTSGQALITGGAGANPSWGAATTSWQSVETGATFTAVAGNGYPVNTTAQACTVTLPAGSVGDTIELVDYAGTWDTNNVTLTADGSEKIKGSTTDAVLNVERQGIKIVYVDATQGWEAITGVNDDTAPALNPPSYDIDFLVVAGGGSGGSVSNAGGGGAGGYRTSTQGVPEGTEITVTVGDGGAGAASGRGITGSASSFSGSSLTTISSAGGGGGGRGSGSSEEDGLDGGSGGGGGYDNGTGGVSSPVTSPVQGYAGGAGSTGSPAVGGGGGGGASEAGDNGSGSKGGDGGDGIASSISGSSVTRAGGGGGGTNSTVGSGGAGGGGASSPSSGGDGVSGTVNTGSGGGAGETADTSGAGGKGVVILSMLDADYSTTVTGSPTVATGQGAGSDTTTLIFTGSGTYTA
jgi:hypothetical protein